MSGDELTLSPVTKLTIVSSTEEALEVEALYAPGGSAPPNHLHPSQDEHFEILEGALQVRLDEKPSELSQGGELDVSRGTPHTMWNEGDVPARTRWITSPALRTEEWFRTLDSLHRRGQEGEVEPEEYIRLLEEYKDVFRLVLPEG
ncbi:MAG TPA: cupin domain-containing protein [Solirubrobacterales bacterium]|nr:cupin domain-containing protein [Solirubrobacterales bacterium]